MSGLAATEFWRAVAAVAGGARQAGGSTVSPTNPVPIPYPTISVGSSVNVQDAGQYFDGQYLVTSVQHAIDSGSYSDGVQFERRRHLLAGHQFTLERQFEVDLIGCLLAAASGDKAAALAHQAWTRTKPKLQQMGPVARRALLEGVSKAFQCRRPRGWRA